MSYRADDFSDDDIFSDEPPPTNSSDTRSEPGKGEICTIYCIGRSLDVPAKEHPEMWMQEAEDYAISNWPVVIKVKNNIPQAELARYLKHLLRSVEHDITEAISTEGLDDELQKQGLI